MPLTFEALRSASVDRCNHVFHPKDGINEWSPTDWATAMAGECGEACNLVKKMRRGEEIPIKEVAKELADLVIYTDLLAARLGIDLAEAVIQKFNEVSDRRGSDIKFRPGRSNADNDE
jgi:NTP pyrophosphatase (non-canonical NTP hydrolase)